MGEGYNSPSWTLSPAFESGIDNLRFHPTSDFLISFTSEGELLLYDFLEQKQLISKKKAMNPTLEDFIDMSQRLRTVS